MKIYLCIIWCINNTLIKTRDTCIVWCMNKTFMKTRDIEEDLCQPLWSAASSSCLTSSLRKLLKLPAKVSCSNKYQANHPFERISSRKNGMDIWSKFKWLLISQYVQCIWKLSSGVVAKKSRKLRTGSEFCLVLASLFCAAAPILLVWAKIVKNWNFVHGFIIGVNGRCNHSIVFYRCR